MKTTMMIIAKMCSEGVGIRKKGCVRLEPVVRCFTDVSKEMKVWRENR